MGKRKGQEIQGQESRLVVGDVVLSVGERRTEDVEDLFDALDRLNPGDRISLTIQRGREQIRVPVRLIAGQ